VNEQDYKNKIADLNEAVIELAHVADNLLERLSEIDPTIGMTKKGVLYCAINNKIRFYEHKADMPRESEESK